MGGSGYWVTYGNTSASTTATDWLDTMSSTGTYTVGGTIPIRYSDVMTPIVRDPRPGDRLRLPDGAALIVDELGNYRIEDQDAKVKYKANRIREFSPQLNASDMVAKFVEYVGSLGVRQSEVLNLPLELFINWLIITAAERDNDPVPADIVPVERHSVVMEIKRPRCLYCQRFISRYAVQQRFPFCNPEHGGRYLEKRQPRRLTVRG